MIFSRAAAAAEFLVAVAAVDFVAVGSPVAAVRAERRVVVVVILRAGPLAFPRAVEPEQARPVGAPQVPTPRPGGR